MSDEPRPGVRQRLADALRPAEPQQRIRLAQAAAYALAGPVRGATFPVLFVTLMFGMFRLSPRTMVVVGLYAVLLFGAVMAAMAWWRPWLYEPAVELGRFVMLAAMLPVISLLAAQLARLRDRNRSQRDELSNALARIQELATRDELTSLINRRHRVELLEQHRQRGARSGLGFCIAVIDIDHFKEINDRHGHAAGDVVLQRFAHEALVAVRVGDVLARADHALYAAKAEGRHRTVVAGSGNSAC